MVMWNLFFCSKGVCCNYPFTPTDICVSSGINIQPKPRQGIFGTADSSSLLYANISLPSYVQPGKLSMKAPEQQRYSTGSLLSEFLKNSLEQIVCWQSLASSRASCLISFDPLLRSTNYEVMKQLCAFGKQISSPLTSRMFVISVKERYLQHLWVRVVIPWDHRGKFRSRRQTEAH